MNDKGKTRRGMVNQRSTHHRLRWSRPIAVGIVAIAAVAIATGSAIASNSNTTPKDAFLQKHASERLVAQAGPRASKEVPPTVPVGAAAKLKRQVGILDVRQGPVSALEFQVRNSWQGPIPGSGSVWYVVWAGSSGSESTTPGVPGLIVHRQYETAAGYSTVDVVVGTFLDR